jgi:hypothetical protein
MHPGKAPFALLRSRFPALLGFAGPLRQCIPALLRDRGAIHRRDPAGFSRKACDARRLAGAPGRHPCRRGEKPVKFDALLWLCAQERAAVGAPLPRRAHVGKLAEWRARCAPVRCMYTEVHSTNPGVRSRTRRAGCPESVASGCVSFGYLSLHKQRKVTRAPAGRVEALHLINAGRIAANVPSQYEPTIALPRMVFTGAY